MTGNDIRTNKRICRMNQYAWGIEAVQMEGADVPDIKGRVINYIVDVDAMNADYAAIEASDLHGKYFQTTPTDDEQRALNQQFLITCDAITYRQIKAKYDLIKFDSSDEGGQRAGDGKVNVVRALCAIGIMHCVSDIENLEANNDALARLDDFMSVIPEEVDQETFVGLVDEATKRGEMVQVAGALAWGCDQTLGWMVGFYDRWHLIGLETLQTAK